MPKSRTPLQPPAVYVFRDSDLQKIKVGNGTDLYALRIEDVNKVGRIGDQLDPNEVGLRFRLPYPDEDEVLPGDYIIQKRGLLLQFPNIDSTTGYDYYSPEYLKDDPRNGTMTIHDGKSGLMFDVKCHHGSKLPEGSKEISVEQEYPAGAIQLISVKRTADGVIPIVRCRHCDLLWREDWDNVLPFVEDDRLRQKLSVHRK